MVLSSSFFLGKKLFIAVKEDRDEKLNASARLKECSVCGSGFRS